jgi:hypothetical protein
MEWVEVAAVGGTAPTGAVNLVAQLGPALEFKKV